MIWSVQKQPLVVFCIKGVMNIFASFTGSTRVGVCQSLFLIKLYAFRATTLFKKDSTQVFSSEMCNHFQNTFFEEHLSTTISECYYRRKNF